MKKIFFFVIASAALLLSMISCEKTSEGLTGITYYPVITLQGGDVVMQAGGSYTEPGFSATLNGEDVSDRVETSNNIGSGPGLYQVTYSVKNDDGFYATASRRVFATNGTAFNNVYLASTKYGTRSYSGAPVVISKNADGTYTIDDLLCGFYWFGRYPGYEPSYDFHNESIIALNADNTVTLIAQGDWYFAPSAIEIIESAFDPEKGTLDMIYDFEGDPFYVSMAVPSAE